MTVRETPIPGAYVIELTRHEDARGFFSRVFCQKTLADAGVPFAVVQSNLSHSRARHTLRGLHYQARGAEEVKLVTCVHGRMLDTIIDLRPDSPTRERTFQVELSGDLPRLLLIPERCAQGFLTLEPDTLVLYQVNAAYSPAHERQVRWDDPHFAIDWPVADPILSDKDRATPDFLAALHFAD